MQELYPIKTYYEKLDNIIGSFYPGEVTLICGHANQFVDERVYFLFTLIKLITYGTGKPGVLFDVYHFSPRTIYSSLIASITSIPETKVCTGKFDESEISFVGTIKKQVYDLPLVIRPMPYFEGVNEEIFKSFKENDIEILYMGCIPSLKIHDKLSVYEEEAFVIMKLKQLSKELNIPIVVCSRMMEKDVYKDEL